MRSQNTGSGLGSAQFCMLWSVEILRGDSFTYIDIASIDNKNQVILRPSELESRRAPSRASRAVHDGDVLFSLVRPYLRNIALVPPEFSKAIASTGFYVCSPASIVSSVFLFNWLRADTFITLITNKMRGDNSPSVKAQDFENAPVPLPPLEEQEGIVARLEDRLAQIDNALERTENVLGIADAQMNNLVRAAVSGNLTKFWRENHEVPREVITSENSLDESEAKLEKSSVRNKKLPLIEDFYNIPEGALVPEKEQPFEVPKEWHWVRLGSISNLISGRDEPLAHCNAEGVGVPYVMGASNIHEDQLFIERWIEHPKVLSRNGALLISVKGTIGKLYVQREPELNLSRQIMALDPHYLLNVEFLRFVMEVNIALLQSRAVGLFPGISRQVLLEMAVPLPPLEEQEEIVATLEQHFRSLRSAQSLLNQSLGMLKKLRSSTLSASLAGRL